MRNSTVTKIVSMAVAVSSLALIGGIAMAATTRAQSFLETSSVPNVTIPQSTGRVSVNLAIQRNAQPTTAAATTTLTVAQKAQAAQVARETEYIDTKNGYVSDSAQALASYGLSASQIAYVENTIQTYDANYRLTGPSSVPTTVQTSVSPNDAIWETTNLYTGQKVVLYEGAQPGIGWQHMMYRHNWYDLGAAQTTVETVCWNPDSYKKQANGRWAYYKWFDTTVPFETWEVEIMIVVNPGNATGTSYTGPGAVVTGYPVAGNYVKETWHGIPNTSIVPWWVNEGQYQGYPEI